tara:strand:+ start:3234 stop:3953 length:720 start_codon:yes stop_codon:yes gene_type:complete
MHSNTLYQLDENTLDFPNPEMALREPNGLLAIGGDLKPERLICAYEQGVFPWYSPDDPILWWSPNPRAIFYPNEFSPVQSLVKTYKRGKWSFTLNTQFSTVIDACSQSRKKDKSTWISPMMKVAYEELHNMGYAHSVESYYEGELVGGLYGILIGEVFCGESMYYTKTDASKLSFWALTQLCVKVGVKMIDGQIPTPHLNSLGSKAIPRNKFLIELRKLTSNKIEKELFKPQKINLKAE